MLILLAPLMAGIALSIHLRMGSPVLFRQVRPGYLGQPFTMLKFRTMVDDDRSDVAPAERVTRLGAFLRRTSLDELPEAWHILLGDMSVVGPRPLLMEYLPYYSDEQLRRHDVRPGLTGWSQVQGRRQVPFQERLAQDVWYVDHQSLRLDARIIFMTIGQVLRGEGAVPDRYLSLDQLGFEKYEQLHVTSSLAADDEQETGADG